MTAGNKKQRIKTVRHAFSLSVQYVAADAIAENLPTRAQFRRWVNAALEQPAELTIRIVDGLEGRVLSRDYRGKDCATNVLTFVYDDTDPLSGDIVLCAEVVEREARQQHKRLLAHYAHLTIHGVLHLQGYDHIVDADAAVMEQKETVMLAHLGFDDPYAADEKQLAVTQ